LISLVIDRAAIRSSVLAGRRPMAPTSIEPVSVTGRIIQMV